MLEPIVISETAQIIAASALIGALAGYIVGWMNGLVQAEREIKQRAAQKGQI